MSSKSSAGSKTALSLPKAKTTNIVIQELENEMLVYDLENDKAHHLNETVSIVWKLCNGKTSANDIAGRLAKRLETEIEEDFVKLAFDELQKANLLDGEPSEEMVDLTRRNVLFRYAPFAVALPVVMSLIAPPAAYAQSCAAPGAPCMTTADCCMAVECAGAPTPVCA